MEKVRESIDSLPWLILLLLVLFVDGLVGGLYRAGGKTMTAKVIGGIMVVSYVLSILAFISLPEGLGTIAHIVTAVCAVADLITVIVGRKISFLAD